MLKRTGELANTLPGLLLGNWLLGNHFQGQVGQLYGSDFLALSLSVQSVIIV